MEQAALNIFTSDYHDELRNAIQYPWTARSDAREDKPQIRVGVQRRVVSALEQSLITAKIAGSMS
jgi:hypothetical protein